jgi:hypothetical protein
MNSTSNKSFKRGSVYKIYSDKTSNIYIGSTTKLLNTRLSNHLHNYNSYINRTHNHYISSFDIIKYGGNIQIELLESTLYNTHNKHQLLELESHYINLYSNIAVNITDPKPIHTSNTITLDINQIITSYFPNYKS